MDNSLNLNGKVAIITGASKGIGASIAKTLAKAGAKLVVSSRKQEAVDQVADAIKAEGNEAIGIACHVGDQNQLENLVSSTTALYGGVDILINNAATNPTFEPISEAKGETFDHVMNVNVKACMLLSNLCFPIMAERGGGSVINIASVEGIKPSAGLGMYSISKAALIMLTKSQAKEWGRAKIRSNAICPGLIKTKFSQAIWQDESMLKKFTKHIPMGRMAQPDEISKIALYLASDASSYSTGSVVSVDGGYLLA